MAARGFKRFVTFQDVLQFLSRYIKYWKLGAFAAILGCVLALAYFVYGKPSYYSKSLVEWSYLDLPIKSEISDLRGNTRWDNIYVQVLGGLQSRWLAERTALRLGLIKDIGELSSVWTHYLSKIKVTGTVASHLEIEVWVYEPWLAKVWPEAMLLEYHDYLTESRIKHRDALVKGFSAEMDRIKENIKAETERDRRFESENQILENYVANNKLEQLPTEMLTYRSQLDAMDEMEKFIDATAPTSAEKLALLQKYRSAPLQVGAIVRRGEEADPFLVKAPQNNVVVGATGEPEKPVAVTPTAATSAAQASKPTIVMPGNARRTEAWQEMEMELRTVEQEYRRLSSTHLPGHEKMRELKKQIDQYQFAIDAEWKKNLEAFHLEKDHLRQRLDELQKNLPEYRKLIAGYDDYRRDFRLQSSGRLAWEQAYVAMKGRLTAMDYTGPEVQVDFTFKGFSEVRDDVPVSPNKKKLLTYALALSFGLGLGAPILTERLRFTYSFVGEAEKYCQYPACGIVPLLEDQERKLLLSSGDSDSGLSHAHESFRIIRSSLSFHSAPDNKRQVIMITSARPNDGKSTVASHLAKSFAEAGDRVLLIDGDLRRGGLHRVFGIKKSPEGLLEILTQNVELEKVLHKIDDTNLSFLPKGKDPKSTGDILGREEFGKFVNGLRSEYDRIIIDTPPLLGIADSLFISKVVDGIIFVIRADQTTQRDVVTASEILHQSTANVYGFVLNCVNLRSLENYYYYGRYYSRYYEPTYYGKETKPKPQSPFAS